MQFGIKYSSLRQQLYVNKSSAIHPPPILRSLKSIKISWICHNYCPNYILKISFQLVKRFRHYPKLIDILSCTGLCGVWTTKYSDFLNQNSSWFLAQAGQPLHCCLCLSVGFHINSHLCISGFSDWMRAQLLYTFQTIVGKHKHILQCFYPGYNNSAINRIDIENICQICAGFKGIYANKRQTPLNAIKLFIKRWHSAFWVAAYK